eukprot:CAMPEP_0181210708 /NCGR_PEP_ID=MMETSP1096-20121128/23385_1 /TAXON_ID=156174 ORGANISM="Chrysochromulina ericina, Strain CCMP281" /NCGR_SAMPLE_ID=MMETSP1096 /ASSEMBLY_ACC=CAM_ASM_000453 /LENGTH=75 /DNA_ID=CAMNT_0023302037 /DNA_START=483 /DNA_END=707 /DNA_ORIENTATION=-
MAPFHALLSRGGGATPAWALHQAIPHRLNRILSGGEPPVVHEAGGSGDGACGGYSSREAPTPKAAEDSPRAASLH